MRRIFMQALGTLTVLFIMLCGVFLFLLLRAPVFEKGESYTFYLGADSSSLFISSTSPARDRLFLSVRGESVQYAGNQLEKLQQKYRAKLLFCEDVCGVSNYYFSSPLLGGGVLLNGYTVNLHIAVSAEKTVAGTPIIFGGF